MSARIATYEQGTRSCNVFQLVQIAQALGVSPSTLLDMATRLAAQALPADSSPSPSGEGITQREPYADVVMRHLGVEIRHARHLAGMTQAQAVAGIAKATGTTLSTQTLASYEQGRRQCPAGQLAQIAQAIGASAPELLKRALDAAAGYIRLDPAALAASQEKALQPLLPWARTLAGSGPVFVDPAVMQVLATFCGMDSSELSPRLLPYASASTQNTRA